MTNTYRLLREFVLDLARPGANALATPDGDWAPMAYFANGDELSSVSLNDVGPQTTWTGAVCDLAQRLHARQVGVLLSVWAVGHEGVDAYPEVRPSLHPDRREELTVAVIDAERIEYWSAPILRDGEQPPALGTWTQTKGELGGRFISRVQQALR